MPAPRPARVGGATQTDSPPWLPGSMPQVLSAGVEENFKPGRLGRQSPYRPALFTP